LTPPQMSAALAQSRGAWLAEGGPEEAADAFQHDEGITTNAAHEILTVKGAAFDPEATYGLMVDAYMVTVNPVLKQWVGPCAVSLFSFVLAC